LGGCGKVLVLGNPSTSKAEARNKNEKIVIARKGKRKRKRNSFYSWKRRLKIFSTTVLLRWAI